jgi:Na+/proline symporter
MGPVNGVAVVLLSSQLDKVPGNIQEVTNKTNGLFVGPLFGLFFMALFVRRATAFGTFIGAIYGFATAVTFAYWDLITGAARSLSFQWIIPSALIGNLS